MTKQKKWPAAYIQSIDPSGLMKIKFNQTMKVPDKPNLLETESIILNDTFYPLLDIKVLPGKLSEPNLLNFSWAYLNFTKT